MAQLSLPRNIDSALDFDDLRRQIGEFTSKLEDHLNAKVDIHVIESQGPTGKLVRPTLKKGDFVIDLNKVIGVATLQFWDGTRLITFNLANFEGFINLITQGIGSGFNPTLYLRSDGNDGWTLDTPTAEDTFEIVATENIPSFSLITTDGKVANSNILAHFNHVVGIVPVGVLSGNVAIATVEGRVTNPLWTWVNNDKLFLNGSTLSTIPPISGFSQFIALAKNSQTVFTRLQIPVLF